MTSLTSAPNSLPLAELQASYRDLGEAERLVTQQFSEALQAGDFEQARRLHAQLEAALDDFRAEIRREPVKLPDKGTLLRHEYEGLQIFAEKNGIGLEKVLDKIQVDDGSVREASFKDMNLITLEGLTNLTALEVLNVSFCKELHSFTGLPTCSLRTLSAVCCGIHSPLNDIREATRLERLYLLSNPGITSLSGVPTRTLIELNAAHCSLTGDLTVLHDAHQLRELDVNSNWGLVSLNGLPSKSIQKLHAISCRLTGDLEAIRAASKLIDLNISENRDITSLDGVPVTALKKLHARRCGLTQLPKALEGARHLEDVDLSGNPFLDIILVKEFINELVTKKK